MDARDDSWALARAPSRNERAIAPSTENDAEYVRLLLQRPKLRNLPRISTERASRGPSLTLRLTLRRYVSPGLYPRCNSRANTPTRNEGDTPFARLLLARKEKLKWPTATRSRGREVERHCRDSQNPKIDFRVEITLNCTYRYRRATSASVS